MSIEEQLATLRRAAPSGTGDAIRVGTGITLGYATYEAPVGEIVVTFSPDGVRRVMLASDFADDGIAARPPRAWANLIPRAIERGRPDDLPLDLEVTPFRRAVLAETAGIPKGEVRSYGWLAIRVGKPGASRAVGSAMAGNPVPLIVPCHRVVRSDGHIGAYSLGGPDNKWTLLQTEGADPDRIEDLARRGIRYLGSKVDPAFCLPSCHDAVRTAEPNLIEFRSLEEAQAAGRTPCDNCLPLG